MRAGMGYNRWWKGAKTANEGCEAQRVCEDIGGKREPVVGVVGERDRVRRAAGEYAKVQVGRRTCVHEEGEEPGNGRASVVRGPGAALIGWMAERWREWDMRERGRGRWIWREDGSVSAAGVCTLLQFVRSRESSVLSIAMSSSIDTRSTSRSRRLLNLSREFPSLSSSSSSAAAPPSQSQIPHQQLRDSVPALAQSATPTQTSSSSRTRPTQDLPLPSSVSTTPSASVSGSQSVPVSTSSPSGPAPATSAGASILSRSSSQRAARLSSFFPALAKAGLVISSSSSSSSAAAASSPLSAHPSSSSAREMRSSRPREQSSKPKALLALKLSGSSFLDTVIRDDKTKDPIYILETVRELTHVYRLDYHRDEPVKAATIQWPIHPVRVKGKTGRSIQFGNGSWREAEELLKTGPLGSNAIRKFNIPHYPNSLKWKLIPGNCFCCVTNAVKGPVAVLDAATLSAPPRLKIYHPLIERELARSQDNYKGIPTIFLDYLVVTSLLLVTDVQEWLDRPREAHIPGSSSYTVQRWLALIHHTPAPPEPDHPTVDLSLTVPSTPPHSATFPNSPGGFWETQSGVTSLSGSGSGASYAGEPFTPTTPATSASSSTFFSRSLEEVPPVPPVPGAGVGSAASGAGAGSPLAHYVEQQGRARERPKSNPQASMTQSPHSSGGAAASHPMQGMTSPGSYQHPHQQHHARAPSMPAPDYDTHSFVNVPPPPLPVPPSSSSGTGSRPPPRRQLTVVNADMPAPVDDDSPLSSSFSPHSSVGSPQSHQAQGMTYTMNMAYNTLNNGGGAGAGQAAAGQQGTAPPPPPSPGDLRLNPRMSYAESVYEMPPPAYDAIDFSVQFVPPVPPLPAHLAVVNVSPQAPMSGPPVDTNAEGQRGP
ncbi:hypothetical protein FKP32DRAFT_1683913 [Trametes sanguinea]|nr:hypothetical protein FKP32DRAFT_1683913 [Trametes sanguinea]